MAEITRNSVSLPADVSTEILQKTQEQSAVMQLSRSVPLPGRGLSVPVITGDPEASWVAETSKKPVSNASLTSKLLQPYKLAVIETFSMEFVRDAKALYDALVARLPMALANRFDATVFGGVNAPGENFDTFANVTAQEIGSNTYAGLVAADADIAEHSGILNGFVIAPQCKAILLSAVDGNGRPLFINSVAEGAIPQILGAKTLTSKGAYIAAVSPARVNTVGFAGDWTQAIFGTVAGVQVTVSDQATLTAGSGEDATTINLWQQNMVAVRAEIEVGFRADTTVFNRLTKTDN